MSAPRRAVTLFSFTNELLAGELVPDALLDRVLRDGVAGLVEIDGPQHFRSFPLLDPEEVAVTARVVRAAGGAVSLLGGGPDRFPAPGEVLDDDIALAQVRSQIEAARLLGAQGVRIAFGVLPWPLLRRAAEDARAAGVVLLEEVQGPEAPDDPALLERLRVLEAEGEAGVRLLLDTSALMGALPRSYIEALRTEGVPDETVRGLEAAFDASRIAAGVIPHLGDTGLTAAARSLLVTALTRFGHGAADRWLPLAPWFAGVHLKWWDLELAAADLAGETGAFLDGLIGAGFTGAVCSEWGGHEWQPLAADAFAQTAAHTALIEARLPILRSGTDFGTKAT